MKIIFTLSFFILVSCASRPPVKNYMNNKVPTGLKLNEIARAIKLGALEKKWVPKRISNNQFLASVTTRGHVVSVVIPFNLKNYSILYHSSENMKYSPESKTIHRKYHSWVLKLRAEIDKKLTSTNE